jgi:hypothetical protein
MSFTVRDSWEITGFGYVKQDDTLYLPVEERKIRTSSGFAELWRCNYRESSLSARRSQQNWGWLNRRLIREESFELRVRV